MAAGAAGSAGAAGAPSAGAAWSVSIPSTPSTGAAGAAGAAAGFGASASSLEVTCGARNHSTSSASTQAVTACILAPAGTAHLCAPALPASQHAARALDADESSNNRQHRQSYFQGTPHLDHEGLQLCINQVESNLVRHQRLIIRPAAHTNTHTRCNNEPNEHHHSASNLESAILGASRKQSTACTPSVPSQAWVLVLGACDPPQQAEQDCCHLVSIVKEHEALADGGMVGLRHSLVQPNHQPQHLQAESIASHASCEQKMHEMPIAAGVQAGAGDQAGRHDSSKRAALVASMLLLLLYMIVPDACIASTLQSTGTAGDAAYCGYCTWVLHVPGCGTLGTPPASG